MAFYRCYNIYTNGRIIGIQNFDAPNDAEACVRADQIQFDSGWYGLEIWEGRRKVPRTVRPSLH